MTVSRWKANGGETEHDLRMAREERRGVPCFLDTFFRACVEESCVLWGHGKCCLRAAVPSTPLLIPPCSLQEKGTRVCVLAARWLPALPLSCPPPHPTPGILGFQSKHLPPSFSPTSAQENFLLLPKGISLKGKSLDLWDPAVISGIREASPEDGVLS